MQRGCAGAALGSCVAEHVPSPLSRCVATDRLWELADETRDVTLQLHSPDLFCNPSVSGAESGGRPRIRLGLATAQLILIKSLQRQG